MLRHDLHHDENGDDDDDDDDDVDVDYGDDVDHGDVVDDDWSIFLTSYCLIMPPPLAQSWCGSLNLSSLKFAQVWALPIPPVS